MLANSTLDEIRPISAPTVQCLGIWSRTYISGLRGQVCLKTNHLCYLRGLAQAICYRNCYALNRISGINDWSWSGSPWPVLGVVGKDSADRIENSAPDSSPPFFKTMSHDLLVRTFNPRFFPCHPSASSCLKSSRQL